MSFVFDQIKNQKDSVLEKDIKINVDERHFIKSPVQLERAEEDFFLPSHFVNDMKFVDIALFLYLHSITNNGTISITSIRQRSGKPALLTKEWRHYSLKKALNRLAIHGAVVERNGSLVLTSKRKVLGRAVNSNLVLLPSSSFTEFYHNLLLSAISDYERRQRYFISLKGGLSGKTPPKLTKDFKRRAKSGQLNKASHPVLYTTRRIASFVGVAQSTVSKMLRNLKERGVILYRSIIKRMKEYIPPRFLQSSQFYLFNKGGHTFAHLGSYIKIIKSNLISNSTPKELYTSWSTLLVFPHKTNSSYPNSHWKCD